MLYQKDSAPHAMTLMKEIEFMIGLFTGTIGCIPEPASISKTIGGFRGNKSLIL